MSYNSYDVKGFYLSPWQSQFYGLKTIKILRVNIYIKTWDNLKYRILTKKVRFIVFFNLQIIKITKIIKC